MAADRRKHAQRRLPRWFIKPILANSNTRKIAALLRQFELNTVCQSARCPNKGACFARGTVTFMILGSVCTRSCAFCAVGKGKPASVDPDEPQRIARVAEALRLRHVVVTSVSRDDLRDGGAHLFAQSIRALRALPHQPRVEVLTPDFGGALAPLAAVVDASPDVFNHNLETIPRLYGLLRPEANYRRSLKVIERVKAMAPAVVTKSGLMVGLGEGRDEVRAVMEDLRQAGCSVLTIGQYLQPSPKHQPVREFVTPETFVDYRLMAQELGFSSVYSAPFVRSSLHAGNLFDTFSQRRKGDENRHHRQAFRVDQGLGRPRSGWFMDLEEVLRQAHQRPRHPQRGEVSPNR